MPPPTTSLWPAAPRNPTISPHKIAKPSPHGHLRPVTFNRIGTSPSLTATDESLRTGRVGMGSFFDYGEFRNFRMIRSVAARRVRRRAEVNVGGRRWIPVILYEPHLPSQANRHGRFGHQRRIREALQPNRVRVHTFY